MWSLSPSSYSIDDIHFTRIIGTLNLATLTSSLVGSIRSSSLQVLGRIRVFRVRQRYREHVFTWRLLSCSPICIVQLCNCKILLYNAVLICVYGIFKSLCGGGLLGKLDEGYRCYIYIPLQKKESNYITLYRSIIINWKTPT